MRGLVVVRVAVGALAAAASLVAGCDSAEVRECGRDARLQDEGGALYCVYDVADAPSGCPSFAPRRLDFASVIVCTNGTAMSLDDLPPGVCRAVGSACARADAGPGIDAGDASATLDASRPPTDDAGPALDDAAPPDGGEDAFIDPDAGGGCPALAERVDTPVSGNIRVDTTWTCARRYRLLETVAVEAGATLTIEAGTVVHGARGARLVVSNDGRIEAVGTADEPIVLDALDGTPGGWSGLALCGQAQSGTPGGRGNIFGLMDTRGYYGGDDETHDCGTLRFVRVVRAGDAAGGEASNGLTIASCGSATQIADVQVHASLDDGIEVRGGAVDLRRVVISAARGRSLIWDTGWIGRVQQLVVRQSATGVAGSNRPAAIEAETLGFVTRRSVVRIYNATLVGPPSGAADGAAMVVSNGGTLMLRDAIVLGFGGSVLDVVGTSTAMLARSEPPATGIEHSLLPSAIFDAEPGADDDDGGLDEQSVVFASARGNRSDDPMLPSAGEPGSAGLVPRSASPASTGWVAPPDDGFFDVSATYVGAFAPDGPDWTAGWTAYPVP